jgi:hypothetical protein
MLWANALPQLRRAGAWALRWSLLADGPRARFMLDTLVTPSLYLALDALTRRAAGAGRLAPAERVAALGEVVLPVLHPARPMAVPLHKAEANVRFRSWVRGAFLDRMFGDSARLREAEARLLGDAPAGGAGGGPPLAAELARLFDVGEWERDPVGRENALQVRLVGEYERGERAALERWGLEEVLESVGCCVAGMNEFNLFCERNFVYEMLTEEYTRELWAHVSRTCARLQRELGASELVVLEVGAGNGSLAYALDKQRRIEAAAGAKASRKAQALEAPAPVSIRVVATDTGVWKAKHHRRAKGARATGGAGAFPVAQMDYRAALEHYKPHVVVCSWMPMSDDWTQAFRDAPSVHEYVLVGEKDEGCCGHQWLTWGHRGDGSSGPLFSENKDLLAKYHGRSLDLFHWLSRSAPAAPGAQASAPGAVPPFQADGFERTELLALRRLQLSRYDRKHYAANSSTVSFSRRPSARSVIEQDTRS